MTGEAPETEEAAARAASGTLTIDLSAIIANWRQLRDRIAPAACAAVVKADAYGTGLTETGSALAGVGCDTFFVAVPAEGIALRRACPRATIYILNGLAVGQGDLYLTHRLRPVLGSTCRDRRVASLVPRQGRSRGCRPPYRHRHEPARPLLAANSPRSWRPERPGSAFPVELLMSHFVTSDNAAHPLNARQIRDFREARSLCPEIPASLANSSGIFLGVRRIMISRGRAMPFSAAIRRRGARTRCAMS